MWLNGNDRDRHHRKSHNLCFQVQNHVRDITPLLFKSVYFIRVRVPQPGSCFLLQPIVATKLKNGTVFFVFRSGLELLTFSLVIWDLIKLFCPTGRYKRQRKSLQPVSESEWLTAVTCRLCLPPTIPDCQRETVRSLSHAPQLSSIATRYVGARNLASILFLLLKFTYARVNAFLNNTNCPSLIANAHAQYSRPLILHSTSQPQHHYELGPTQAMHGHSASTLKAS